MYHVYCVCVMHVCVVSMCVGATVCMYECVFCVNVYMYVICTCISACIGVCRCVHACVCVSRCMRACVLSDRKYVCVHVCVSK